MPGALDLTTGLRRVRRTAAVARAAMAATGIVMAFTIHDPDLARRGAVIGFAIILATALVELTLPRHGWLVLEESLAPLAAILIVGLGPETVTTRILLWLSCVVCGVLARGGRQHGFGGAVLLLALAMPIVRSQALTPHYTVVCLTTIALLLTCGRVTRELRDLLARARHEADHDGLTGALTSATFRSELERLTAVASVAGARLGLLLLDLDDFGAVNKSAGHAAGDALLVDVAHAIAGRAGVAAPVGRLGGDEFAVVIQAEDPVAVGDAILAAVSDGPGLAASGGMALRQCDADDAEGLLRAADVALRVGKRSGRTGVSVYAGESLSQTGRGGARDALERLIAGEGLNVVVQPIATLPGGEVHAYEALARFQAGASSSPLHWFALAEELGMRERLEIACLSAGLRVMAERPAGSRLSVNLSGSLLLRPEVAAQLDALGSLDGLILELTENSLLEDSSTMRAEFARLTARGARFAVDDVGSGYSGLRQITTLRPTYLKLDRSLISGIDADPGRTALVSAMVSYARQTGGHLVAEGVETAAELRTLATVGVVLVQGYYLARPGWPWPQPRSPYAELTTPAPGVPGVPGVPGAPAPAAPAPAIAPAA